MDPRNEQSSGFKMSSKVEWVHQDTSTPQLIHQNQDNTETEQCSKNVLDKRGRPESRIHKITVLFTCIALMKWATAEHSAVYCPPAWQIRQWPWLIWPLLFLLENFLGMQTMMMTVHSRAEQCGGCPVGGGHCAGDQCDHCPPSILLPSVSPYVTIEIL